MDIKIKLSKHTSSLIANLFSMERKKRKLKEEDEKKNLTTTESLKRWQSPHFDGKQTT